jgi:hypothetical protein
MKPQCFRYMNSLLRKSRVNHNFAAQASYSFIEREELRFTLQASAVFSSEKLANPTSGVLFSDGNPLAAQPFRNAVESIACGFGVRRRLRYLLTFLMEASQILSWRPPLGK